MSVRIGHGYDIHPLKKGKKLFLGGIEIPHDAGLESTTDGDVLIHALIDAILGALGEGDIGTHFPSSDPQYKGMASSELLTRTRGILQSKGYILTQMDATLIAEQPKLSPHVADMKWRIADSMEVRPSIINIKPKTNAGVGEIGRGEAIAAHVVCLLEHAPWRNAD